MWYWDYTPSGNYYKKPLTKKQLEKMKENFRKWWEIAEHVQELEKKENEKNKENIEEKLDSLFL